MSARERSNEVVAENNFERIVLVPRVLGDLAMPTEAKKAYAFLDKNSDQLVIEHYAYDFDVTPVPID